MLTAPTDVPGGVWGSHVDAETPVEKIRSVFVCLQLCPPSDGVCSSGGAPPSSSNVPEPQRVGWKSAHPLSPGIVDLVSPPFSHLFCPSAVGLDARQSPRGHPSWAPNSRSCSGTASSHPTADGTDVSHRTPLIILLIPPPASPRVNPRVLAVLPTLLALCKRAGVTTTGCPTTRLKPLPLQMLPNPQVKYQSV